MTKTVQVVATVTVDTDCEETAIITADGFVEEAMDVLLYHRYGDVAVDAAHIEHEETKVL